MKVLVASAMYPSEERPAFGTFVRTQVESLRGIGVDAEPFVLTGRSRKLMYLQAVVFDPSVIKDPQGQAAGEKGVDEQRLLRQSCGLVL